MHEEWLEPDARRLRLETRSAGHAIYSGTLNRKRVLARIDHPPSERACELAELVRHYIALHGHAPIEVSRVRAPTRPRGLWSLGELDAVIYQRPGMAQKHVHHFTPGARPVLATNRAGDQLHVVGGIYVITDHGIED